MHVYGVRPTGRSMNAANESMRATHNKSIRPFMEGKKIKKSKPTLISNKMAEGNRPVRENTYMLQPNEVKLGYKRDPKILNSSKFIVEKEDHTIGNLLRMKLLEDPTVRFAGYRHPHPLDTFIELKIRTDGSKDSVDALKNSVEELIAEFNTLENHFKQKQQEYEQQAANQFGDDTMM